MGHVQGGTPRKFVVQHTLDMFARALMLDVILNPRRILW